MAKLETIFCATTWGLMNALLIALAFEFAAPLDQSPPTQMAAAATTAAAPAA